MLILWQRQSGNRNASVSPNIVIFFCVKLDTWITGSDVSRLFLTMPTITTIFCSVNHLCSWLQLSFTNRFCWLYWITFAIFVLKRCCKYWNKSKAFHSYVRYSLSLFVRMPARFTCNTALWRDSTDEVNWWYSPWNAKGTEPPYTSKELCWTHPLLGKQWK